MGIIKQGILGAFSGKVGAVVGSSWKGIAVMKSRPASVANPRTAGQVLQRNSMSKAVAFAQPILAEILKPLNDRFASRMSGFNLFVQRNIDAFKGKEGLSLADVAISPRGGKAQLIDAIAIDTSGKKVRVSWSSDAGQGFALGDDIPFVVLHSSGKNETWGWRGVRDRADGFTVAPIPEELENILWDNAYLAFLRADGTVVFSTAYSSTIGTKDFEDDPDSELDD